MTDLINISYGKIASQSSESSWSKENDAERAILDIPIDDFAFHTAEDESPWWKIDLFACYNIKLIKLHNRIKTSWHRAKNLLVEFSVDNIGWEVIYINHRNFGHDKHALVIELEDKCARYVRVRLPSRNYLHLSRVEIFSDKQSVFATENDPHVSIPNLVTFPKISLGLLGTSNSITGGYKTAFNQEYFSVLTNLSIGSSHSCLIPYRLHDLSVNCLDYIIFDFFPNHERALRVSNTYDFIHVTQDIIKWALGFCKDKGIIPIFLMLPSVN